MKNLILFAFFAFIALPNEALLQTEVPRAEYIEVTTFLNFGQNKQFARYTDGNTSIEVMENGSKLNFQFSMAKLCNYFHSLGYVYIEPIGGPMLETEKRYLFKLE